MRKLSDISESCAGLCCCGVCLTKFVKAKLAEGSFVALRMYAIVAAVESQGLPVPSFSEKLLPQAGQHTEPLKLETVAPWQQSEATGSSLHEVPAVSEAEGGETHTVVKPWSQKAE